MQSELIKEIQSIYNSKFESARNHEKKLAQANENLNAAYVQKENLEVDITYYRMSGNIKKADELKESLAVQDVEIKRLELMVKNLKYPNTETDEELAARISESSAMKEYLKNVDAKNEELTEKISSARAKIAELAANLVLLEKERGQLNSHEGIKEVINFCKQNTQGGY